MRLHSEQKVAEYRAKGYWNDDTIPDLFRKTVSRAPTRLAIVDPANKDQVMGCLPRQLTWYELDEEVRRMQVVLLSTGVGFGDRVGVQLPNTVEGVVTFLAAWGLGAIVVPFPVQYREYELVQLSGISEIKFFITAAQIGGRQSAEEFVRLLPQIPSIESVMCFGLEPPAGTIPLDEAIAKAGSELSNVDEILSKVELDPADCVTICWTSGTESTPKGVMRAHCDWLAMAWATIDGPGLTDDDVLLNPFPMVNMAGINGMFLPWIRVGGLLVQHHPFHLPTFLQQIRDQKATYTVAPPALLTQLLANPQMMSEYDISSLRLLGSGSAPLAPSLLRGWHDRYGLEILNFYGSNEGITLMGVPMDIASPEERAMYFPRYGIPGKTWSFRLAQWTEVRIVDPASGEDITTPGVPGELRIKGPTVFGGYLPASSKSDPIDADGFLCSGDIMEIAGDHDEYLRYVDRSKDMIARGGMKIAPAELETLLAGHPQVADVTVVSYPDPIYTEKVCAVIVPNGDPPTLDELCDFLRSQGIASYKLPERIEIVESLPRNPVGKVLKREIRSRLWQESTPV